MVIFFIHDSIIEKVKLPKNSPIHCLPEQASLSVWGQAVKIGVKTIGRVASYPICYFEILAQIGKSYFFYQKGACRREIYFPKAKKKLAFFCYFQDSDVY